MRTLQFSSILPVSYRDELERIVFFNPEQERVTGPLLDSVRRYGVPGIFEDGGLLRFRVPAFGAIQSLFAFDQSDQPARLVGVVMFVRESPETMLLLHLAVHEEYVGDGRCADAWVAPRLVAAVRAACRRTRGIKRLRMLYPREAQVRLDSAG